MARFDLVSEPWIPCLALEGDKSVVHLGLRDVLVEAHRLRAIVAENPAVAAALHRLLIAILHRVVEGPRNEDEWGRLWRAGSFEAGRVERYLEQWRERFDLFHSEHPFCQTARLDPKKTGAAVRLLFQADNNPTLFDHTVTSSPPGIPPARAARALLAFQAFDTSGTKTGWGRGPDKAKAAPLIQCAVMLLTGRSLFETLMLNLHAYDGDSGWPFEFDEKVDSPAWEQPSAEGPTERAPHGYLDLLTWQSRAVLLIAEATAQGHEVLHAIIMKLHQFPAGYALERRETMVAFKRIEKPKPGRPPWVPIGFREDRTLWRDSLAFLQTLGHSHVPPLMARWVVTLLSGGHLDEEAVVPVEFHGLAADPKKAARLILWRSDRLSLPMRYFDDAGLVFALGRAITAAEAVATGLRRALEELGRRLLGNRAKGKGASAIIEALGSERAYWAAVETPFRKLVLDLALDRSEDVAGVTYGARVLPVWGQALTGAARRAFARTVTGLAPTGEALRAIAMAERSLGAWLVKIRCALESPGPSLAEETEQ